MDMPRIANPSLPLLLLLIPLQGAEAGVYKCTDAMNRVFYQDKACQELNTEKLPTHLSQMGEKDDRRSFLWKATSGKGTAYLLGSLHFGAQDMYPLPERITDAFAAANVLVVEANLRNLGPDEAAKKLTAKGLYTDGSTLEEHVKPATWRKLTEIAKGLGVNEDALRPQKPWAAALTLTGKALAQGGFAEDLGVDQAFIKEAGGKKPILELETVDEQLKLFDQFSAQEQEQMLLQTLQDIARSPGIFKDIQSAWKKGDLEAIDVITRQRFDGAPLSTKLFQTLFTDRNTAMANQIDEMLADGRVYFIVIGAAHLAGEQGIIKLLEDKGYRISQP